MERRPTRNHIILSSLSANKHFNLLGLYMEASYNRMVVNTSNVSPWHHCKLLDDRSWRSKSQHGAPDCGGRHPPPRSSCSPGKSIAIVNPTPEQEMHMVNCPYDYRLYCLTYSNFWTMRLLSAPLCDALFCFKQDRDSILCSLPILKQIFFLVSECSTNDVLLTTPVELANLLSELPPDSVFVVDLLASRTYIRSIASLSSEQLRNSVVGPWSCQKCSRLYCECDFVLCDIKSSNNENSAYADRRPSFFGELRDGLWDLCEALASEAF